MTAVDLKKKMKEKIIIEQILVCINYRGFFEKI